ncbi:MAG: hypothetical protein ACRDGK_08210 [Actinomycetota bacterium]
MTERRRVLVLFGGRSAEHEISCISARSVMDALDPERYEVIPVGITREGRWQVMAGPPAVPVETGRMPEVIEGSGTSVELSALGAAGEVVGGEVVAVLLAGFAEEPVAHCVTRGLGGGGAVGDACPANVVRQRRDQRIVGVSCGSGHCGQPHGAEPD